MSELPHRYELVKESIRAAERPSAASRSLHVSQANIVVGCMRRHEARQAARKAERSSKGSAHEVSTPPLGEGPM